jgi:hypothetical protein
VPRERDRVDAYGAVALKSFTLYVDGNEVYAKPLADAIESDLQPLVSDKLITRVSKYDTNPANNPQAPAQYRN